MSVSHEAAPPRADTISRRSVWAPWAPLGGLIFVAGILRFSGIQAQSLWGDEIISLALATGHSWYPWRGEETELFYSAAHYRDQLSIAPTYFSQRLVWLLQVNDQPPFYYALLNLWVHLFGTSEAAVRSLSLLASVGSIPLLYGLGRQLASHQAGLYSAAIFALAPFQVAFALYNRPYALLGFFALVSTLAAVHLTRDNPRVMWLVVYALTVILGFYTHYLFVWNLLFQVPFVLFCQRHNRRFLVRFGATCLLIAGACLVWVPVFLEQSRWSRSAAANSWFYWYSGRPSLSGTVISLGHSGLKLFSAGRITSGAMAGALTVISYLVPLLLCCLVFWRLIQHLGGASRQSNRRLDPWAVCLLWGACVMAGPVIMDLLLKSHMVYSHRYFIGASGPVYLTGAMALAGIRQASLRVGIGAGFLAFLLISSVLYLQGSAATLMSAVAVRDVAQHIDQRSTGADDLILVLDPGFTPLDFAYYLRSNPEFARVNVPDRYASAPEIASQLRTITSSRERTAIWYLDDRGPETQARADVLEWLRARYVQVETREFTNIDVFLFSPHVEIESTPGAHN